MFSGGGDGHFQTDLFLHVLMPDVKERSGYEGICKRDLLSAQIKIKT